MADEAERPLRAAITALIAMPDPAIAPADRIAAARVLGELGDPRFPVEMVQWQAELYRRNCTFGAPEGYFCYVPAGTYRIGGWEADAMDETDAMDADELDELDERDAQIDLPNFWIARFPSTVTQYAPFVAVGYGPDAERWWTPNSWRWKQERERTQPWGWDVPRYHRPNHPVIRVSWYAATAFCAWLSEQVGAGLPPGYVLRLPTEAEREVAAYAADGTRRPYPWGEDEATSEWAIYDAAQLVSAASVGCCPAGRPPAAPSIWPGMCGSGRRVTPRRTRRGVRRQLRISRNRKTLHQRRWLCRFAAAIITVIVYMFATGCGPGSTLAASTATALGFEWSQPLTLAHLWWILFPPLPPAPSPTRGEGESGES